MTFKWSGMCYMESRLHLVFVDVVHNVCLNQWDFILFCSCVSCGSMTELFYDEQGRHVVAVPLICIIDSQKRPFLNSEASLLNRNLLAAKGFVLISTGCFLRM